jgi:hypothetical protein
MTTTTKTRRFDFSLSLEDHDMPTCPREWDQHREAVICDTIRTWKYGELRREYARALPWLDSRVAETRHWTGFYLAMLIAEAERRRAYLRERRASAARVAGVERACLIESAGACV